MASDIVVKGAREHNLKNIDVGIPRGKFVVITGLSGSGKSTLAFDTLYAEGQRRYVESLSAYARQFLGLMNKPDVDSIEGLSPAISIEQKSSSHNPRSTVGTTTEIYDYYRLLFARIGIPHCPKHGEKIQARSPESIMSQIEKDSEGETITVLAPIVRQKKGTHEMLIENLNKDGYTRARVDGKIVRTDEKVSLERYKKHDIYIVLGRFSASDRARLAEAVEESIRKAEGLVNVLAEDGKEKLYSSKMACPVCAVCGETFEELQPRMFSFNSPFGACEACHGLGIRMEFDEDLIIPDKSLSIAEGAMAIYRNHVDGWRVQNLAQVAKYLGFDALTPIKDLTKEQYDALMHGLDDEIRFVLKSKDGGSSYTYTGTWEGVIPQAERIYQKTESEWRKKELSKFMRTLPCPACRGRRLKEKVLHVKIAGKSIMDITDMPIKDELEFFRNLKLSKKDEEIARQILKEIKQRLKFLSDVGLSYLSLSRSSDTLSGGEAQRIRLATQIGTNLTGVLYILDEPSIGLHQRDNQKLIRTLKRLRDLGNTLVVVEHDEETIRSADHVIDMGPGAGVHGGRIVAQGTPKEIEKNAASLTGKYLSGKLKIEVPKKRRKPDGYIEIAGAEEHNLKNITVRFPLRVFTCITGVSGSGKSTLVYDILHPALKKEIGKEKAKSGKYETITIKGKADRVIVIDQSPIGRTPRSNPATYIKVFDDIRALFARTKEAKLRGYKPGRFSFNVAGGRCEACRGDGVIKIEMNFLPDVYIECEECKGKRYNRETLEVLYKGKNIADVLKMTVEEALSFFDSIPSIKRKLKTLADVGLGYIELGQPATTLSGGEAQRIKLTRELSKRHTGNTVYLLDEPTTGLHFDDIKKLLSVLSRLVDKGNTVIVIEHNLDVVKSADHIIDLGPEGGDEGGRIVAQGTPEDVAKSRDSYTGHFLKSSLK
ncbi:MAG: excinuclease ABC subunit UvrA [Candidatus Micrarchaeota archaeon]|nr:excinuclease ABC subunit UvrA [Candidatus Micrarchaeota archaeon]